MINHYYPLIFSSLLLMQMSSNAQTGDIFSDDYSSNQGWTQINSGYSIGNGKMNAVNAVTNFTPSKVYKLLRKDISMIDDWKAELEFMNDTPDDIFVAADIIALTTSEKDFRATCATPTSNCTAIAPLSEQAVVIHFSNSNTEAANKGIFIGIHAYGQVVTTSADIKVTRNVPYYISFTKSDTVYTLNTYSDLSRTRHIAGSPVQLKGNAAYSDLNYIQHGSSTSAGNHRKVSFVVDNISVTLMNIKTTIANAENSEKSIHLFPSPASDKVTVNVKGMEIDLIEILNLEGQTVSSSSSSVVNISKLNAGIYLVKVFSGGAEYSEKLFVR